MSGGLDHDANGANGAVDETARTKRVIIRAAFMSKLGLTRVSLLRGATRTLRGSGWEAFRACGVLVLFGVVAASITGCGNPAPLSDRSGNSGSPGTAHAEGRPAAAELVKPPFAVRGECDGLLLVYFDGEGPHTAPNRSAIPEASRQFVRVDSLSLDPAQRLDPAYVYVADLRAPQTDGAYSVRKMEREAFEGLIDKASGVAAAEARAQAAATASNDVIIYGAEWCGACHATAAFFRQRGIAFVEKDIERDAAAQAEMQRKAHAAGVPTTGIPVIDFRGRILTGFDQAELERLIALSPDVAQPTAEPDSAPGGDTPPRGRPI